MKKEKLYIGSKIVKAYPLNEYDFLRIEKGECAPNRENRHGYLVKYPDGYVSWSPKNVFENAYREITSSEKALV